MRRHFDTFSWSSWLHMSIKMFYCITCLVFFTVNFNCTRSKCSQEDHLALRSQGHESIRVQTGKICPNGYISWFLFEPYLVMYVLSNRLKFHFCKFVQIVLHVVVYTLGVIRPEVSCLSTILNLSI